MVRQKHINFLFPRGHKYATIPLFFCLALFSNLSLCFQLCAHPLPDNDHRDNYLYELTVFTGDKDGAATDSRIFFILSGDDDETDARTFGDSKSKLFRRGGTDTFVMACSKPLGRLNYMRIWHDNSGKGKFR